MVEEPFTEVSTTTVASYISPKLISENPITETRPRLVDMVLKISVMDETCNETYFEMFTELPQRAVLTSLTANSLADSSESPLFVNDSHQINLVFEKNSTSRTSTFGQVDVLTSVIKIDVSTVIKSPPIHYKRIEKER